MTITTPGVVPASILVRDGKPGWLRDWVRFAAGTRFADLSPDAAERAVLVLLDCLGVIGSGMAEPEMRALASRMVSLGGDGPAPLIGTRFRAAPGTAAFVNGTAGTMLELDEGNQYSRGHPAIHVVPAALAAAARTGSSGAELLRAVALGYEIGARIGIASRLRVSMHPHGTWGVVGAALAVGLLEGADEDQLAELVNVSSSLALATSRRTMLEGGTVRNSYAGFANQLGLQAWEMVAAGFVGEADGIGTVYGGGSEGGIVADGFDPTLMTEALGTRWEIARNYFKRHAACRYTHGALDALALIIAHTGPLDPAAVAAMEVDTYVWAAQLDHPAPRNMLAAKFSLPFAMATAVVNGAATVPAFRAPALADEKTRALAARVSVREDPALTAMLPGLRPARLLVRMTDGTEHRAEVTTNRGDTEAPYGSDEVSAKFHELADPVWGAAAAARLRDAVSRLPHAASTAELDRLLNTEFTT